MRNGRGMKKIMPVCTPLFMLFLCSYMNAAIQFCICCHMIMRCYLTTKWQSHHHVLLTKIFENLFIFSKCGKGKTKEMYRFIVKKEGCIWIASNLVWKKLDLAIASVSLLLLNQMLFSAAHQSLLVSLRGKAIKLLIISSTNINLLNAAELLLAPRTIFSMLLSRWRVFVGAYVGPAFTVHTRHCD